MELKLIELKATIKEDLDYLDKLIKENLNSNISLINDVLSHIVKNSGKRLRPFILLLSANACVTEKRFDNYWPALSQNENASITEKSKALKSKFFIAAAIEFIHTATLLHDDVVDESKLRRSQPTTNSIWGNKTAILMGDYLYSRAFQLLSQANNLTIFELIANTTTKIAEGEVLQLENQFNSSPNEQNYFKIIDCKTAQLFEACTKAGAILENSHPEIIDAMAKYGHHIGMAFQLIDDALDYSSDSETLGKNIGDDLADGKATLPLIYAMNNTTYKNRLLIKQSIEKGSIDQLEEIKKIIMETKAIAYTKSKAKKEIEKAIQSLKVLPNSKYKNTLEDLSNFVIERSS